MNNPNSLRDSTGNLLDQAATSADNAVRSTQKAAGDALDGMVSAANGLRADVAPMISRASEQASALAHRGADAVRHSAQHLQERADAASARTRGYVQVEPVKALLLAAATGAALMALLSLASHARQRS